MKKNRPNDVISIPHRLYVSLNGYTWSFRVHENALARSGMLSYAICNVFLIMDNQRGIHSYQIRQLPCHARGARAHNLCSHLPFHMDSFVYGNVFFFPLIEKLVCTIQSDQTLDALIKYVAEYHILYSGQFEIRLSVYLV